MRTMSFLYSGILASWNIPQNHELYGFQWCSGVNWARWLLRGFRRSYSYPGNFALGRLSRPGNCRRHGDEAWHLAVVGNAPSLSAIQYPCS